MKNTKFLTTPIYYVNDVPHIGHAYCTLATDTLARFWRGRVGEENVFFCTGTDENSQKTVDAAKKAGKPVRKYLDEMAENWRATWDRIGISYDDFIRTTEARHVETVHEILKKIWEAGDIYRGKYSGKYCTGCETFLKDSDLDADGNCPDHRRKPEILEEANYFFRLSKYEGAILELFEKNPEFLLPESRRNEILSFVRGGLDDISISRESAEMGISCPWDENHKIYVWIEALINYRTVCPSEDFWNGVAHIIGKDISKFHAVIWPAMLMSAGILPPAGIFAHGFFTIDGVKMSKSLGNVISPVDLAEKFGNDALRVGLLGSFEFGNDGDFSVANFSDFYRTKLAGGVGNLFNRVLVLAKKFKIESRAEISTEILKKFDKKLENYEIRGAIEQFFELVGMSNERLNETEVWKLAKANLASAEKIFSELLGHLATLAEMAEVILPESAGRMREMIEKREGGVLFPQV